jgi:hypothetical protein
MAKKATGQYSKAKTTKSHTRKLKSGKTVRVRKSIKGTTKKRR